DIGARQEPLVVERNDEMFCTNSTNHPIQGLARVWFGVEGAATGLHVHAFASGAVHLGSIPQGEGLPDVVVADVLVLVVGRVDVADVTLQPRYGVEGIVPAGFAGA